MKVYVAGINLNVFINLYGASFSCLDRVKCISSVLPRIVDDGRKSLGEDAIVFVVLHEYILTRNAISAVQKRQALTELQKAIEPYKNMILIPGSLLISKNFKDYKAEKRDKKLVSIWRNYQKNQNRFPGFKREEQFRRGYVTVDKACLRISEPNKNFENIISLQNTGFIFTAEGARKPIKHKKSVLTDDEQDKLKNDKGDVIADVGADSYIKEVTVNNNKLKLSLLICLEHFYKLSEISEINEDLPLFQIIVSNVSELYQNNLYGAVNIYMDAKYGLSVHVNDNHEQAALIKSMQIKAFCYTPFLGQVEVEKRPITHFSNKLVKSSVQKPIPKMDENNNNSAPAVKQLSQFGKLFQDLKDKSSSDDVSTVEDIRKRDANVVQQMTKKFLG